MNESLAASEQAELAAVRARREALYRAILGLEDALASPVGEPERWRLRVAMAVDHASARITEHIDQTESPDGLLARIGRDEPRLTRKLEQLKVDHEQLAKSVDALAQALADVDHVQRDDLGGGDKIEHQATLLRNQAVELLGELTRHRQRGSDLIYEAFHVDIGQSS